MTTRKFSNLFGLLPILHAGGTAAAGLPNAPTELPEVLTLEAEGDVEWIKANGEEDGDEGAATPKFSMVAYRGGKMRPAGWGGDVVLDLAGTTIAKGKRPALYNHNSQTPVGHFEDGGIQNNGKQIKAEGVLSVESDEQRKIIQSSRAGFPWKSSIGAAPDWSKIEFVDAGDSRRVNGKVQRGPFTYVKAAQVHEVSFVTIAGDDTSSAAVKANRSMEGSHTMTFEQFLEANGYDIETLTEKQLKPLRAAWKAELKASGDDGGNDSDAEPGNTRRELNAGGNTQTNQQPENELPSLADQLRAEGAAEVERQSKLRGLFAGAQLPEDRRGELLAQAISENWNNDRAELEILRAGRGDVGNGGQVAIHSRNKNLTAGALSASVAQTIGVPEEIAARGVSEKDMNIAAEAENRGLTLHALMDVIFLKANGYQYSGNRKSPDFVRAVGRADRQLAAAGFSSSLNASGNTTISLTGILGNVGNKAMLAAFESVETVYQQLCRMASHSDFKPRSTYRLDIDGGYKLVGPDGLLKHSEMSETGFTAKVDTYGTMLTLTRQDMINDDLDAFAQIATQLGIMAGTVMEEVFWKLVLGNFNNFFSVANKNKLSGAQYSLGIEGLQKAVSAFNKRVKKDGSPILLSPKKIAVGTLLEDTANDLYVEKDVQVTGTASKKSIASNRHRGKYMPVASPYLDNEDIRDREGKAIPNQSASKYILFADPKNRAAFVCATLNGNNLPTIESDESAFNTLGMQWRGVHDFGFGEGEPEAALEVDGTD
ncbi:phage major capsid protein [Bremerella sp. T1]|uniref:phage major capsid protein n=1 Tax=Bremerella sp. TYQ1 TaxID=3119568 RepID=UPI001CCBD39B|nr:hypothetical protein [Bremerella volcania]UBM38419.1 hypothetical protein LA756_11085 [Bremerella volcania]